MRFSNLFTKVGPFRTGFYCGIGTFKVTALLVETVFMETELPIEMILASFSLTDQ